MLLQTHTLSAGETFSIRYKSVKGRPARKTCSLVESLKTDAKTQRTIRRSVPCVVKTRTRLFVNFREIHKCSWTFLFSSTSLQSHQHKVPRREVWVEQRDEPAVHTCRETRLQYSECKGRSDYSLCAAAHRSPAGRSSCPAAPASPPQEPAAGTG